MSKKCSKCKQTKSLSNFNKNKNRKDGRQTYCRDCSKKNSSLYYKDNPKKYIIYNQDRKKSTNERDRLRIKEIKSAGCSLCPENEPICLDFHHIDPSNKKHGISWLLLKGYSWETIQKEIDKCILVCSNCHRKIHAGIIKV